MNLLDELKKRRSYKFSFDKKQIDPQIIDRCIKISCWAPSAHNSQPWRYIILNNVEIRIQLINEMNDKLREDLKMDGKSIEYIEKKINSTRKQFLEAPYLILSCVELSILEDYPDIERKNNEFLLGIMSVASSITYLLISFQMFGLVACWYSAPIFAREIVLDVLRLPNKYYPIAFITVGYPKVKNIKPPKRQPLNKILFFSSDLKQI